LAAFRRVFSVWSHARAAGKVLLLPALAGVGAIVGGLAGAGLSRRKASALV
jgi:hypothetical protein